MSLFGRLAIPIALLFRPMAITWTRSTVAEFNDFTPENDPHGEHDFLSFEHCNRTWFWKCDYYDKEMDGGSEDPADPDKTTRVGTLMLAEDY